jgi:hypothetical protein
MKSLQTITILTIYILFFHHLQAETDGMMVALQIRPSKPQIVLEDVTRQDLEKLHVLMQENKSLEEIEACEIWRKLDNPTKESFQNVREFPKEKDKSEQIAFLKFHDETMLDIQRHLLDAAATCHLHSDYNHEIALFDKVFLLSRFNYNVVRVQNVLLRQHIYPLFRYSRLSSSQKRRLFELSSTRLYRLPFDKIYGTATSHVYSPDANEKEKTIHYKVYSCAFINSLFLLSVMNALSSEGDNTLKVDHFQQSLSLDLAMYGLKSSLKGRITSTGFQFYMMTHEPMHFHFANEKECVHDGEREVEIK